MLTNKTIILADDHPLILEGNKAYLTSAGFRVIDTATDGNEAFNKVVMQNPDVAILDMEMPILKGLEVATHLQQKKSAVKVIILSLHSSQAICDAVGKTIHGYLLKDDALGEILKCIETVCSDRTYLSAKIAGGHRLADTPEILQSLTASELKILQYIAKKMTSHEIAEALFLSVRTVEKHRENIIRKLGLTQGANSLHWWVSENKDLFL